MRGNVAHFRSTVCVSQDPSTKRRHPRGYIEFLEQHNTSLENHVAFLEHTIRECNPDLDLDNLPRNRNRNSDSNSNSSLRHEDDTLIATSTDEAVDPTLRRPLSSPQEAPPSLDKDGVAGVAAEPDSLAPNSGPVIDDMSSLELLCLRSAGADPHYFGASSAYSFTKMFSASLRAVRKQAPGLTMSGIRDQSFESRPCATPAPLPNRALVSMLTSAYFDQVHPQFPFLHRPSYLQWEEEVMAASEAGMTPNPVYAFFVYALCAVGALTGPLAGATLPEGLYAAAEGLFENVMQQNSLESIQAILCCAMYSIRSPIGVSVWMLSGLALRQCLELGLHRKIRWSKMKSNSLKVELRKRVFWCSYNLDRAVAITLGRPVGIADHDIDVELPLDIDDEYITMNGVTKPPRTSKMEPVTTISTAIHTIRLRQIWARIQSSVYPQVGAEATIQSSALFERFKRELADWLESAPEQLPSNRANNNSFGSKEWFSLMYHHSILLLHRHRLHQYRHHHPNHPTPSSVYMDCAHSAQAICMVYRQLYVSQRLNDTWGALHVLFLGGVTFLHCLWSSRDARLAYRQDKVSTICTSALIVLAIMAERWSAVEAYRDAFEMLCSATQTMLAETSSSSASCPPTMPVISSTGHGHDQFTDYLSYMTEVGMCSSVEELLSNMVE
ncbi:hypothetical protein A1O3_04708 [Capronia epimyces CBS 606.96]|uniref:Xylanolytic transcriptional activator regulatory domain-containing protein n=1 Tax=Capronia epimyces CBS 606.96 TaxID=1182542 RepID=W9Y499_9EURO|nr:uncharacterized protein A1O3_04708 [Capronia epimyces CBS 606.96]EXJ84041.1 hypothetical protein A1O3_04708 [Capronia epimyces CBS 606.96]